MRLYTSNRAEVLVDRLAEVVKRPCGGPFEAEVVLVHSPGMGAWLKQRISERVGVCANVRFPFPAHFIPELFDAVVPDQAGADASSDDGERDDADAKKDRWTRSMMRWAILAELPERLMEPAFTPVRRYLRDAPGDPRDPLKTIQLAGRIARVFTGYLYYRPEMIQRWQAGEDAVTGDPGEAWQAQLWRGVRARLDQPNVVERAAEFRARVAEIADAASAPKPRRKSKQALSQLTLDLGAPAPEEAPDVVDAESLDVPPRVCVFGVSSLPPLQLDILGELAKLTEVHLFVLSPSSQFFAEIRTARSIARAAAKANTSMEDEHLEVGNPLLASLGKLGRDFQHLLYDTDLPVTLHDETFVDPVEPETSESREQQPDLFPRAPTALEMLQSDILNLRHRGHAAPGAEAVPVYALDDNDRSISVHACHGSMRQVEVLHDQLLDLFRRDPSLDPSDVLVMCPDLEAFGPLVEAVFRRPGDDTRDVPFRIADRSLRRDSPVGEAFLAWLDLIDSRFSAPDVMDLLAMPLVHRRFGISSDDLPRISQWIADVGIRWGIDAAHRASHGQPAYAENTWRFGIDRLLIGAAMIGEGRSMFAGVLPYDPIEGSAAVVAGKLAEFATTLFAHARSLIDARTLTEWRDDISAALAAIVHNDDEHAWQHEQIRRLLDEAADEATRVGVAERLPLTAVRSLLRDALSEGRSPYGFLSGAVTFCEMLPMRAIPFRVVAMLGMDERAFPRNTSRMRFDLVTRKAHRGDRSPRDDDRYLFLESLLSARERLIITYTGQSVRDNSSLPPAVVVSELLDSCAESFGVKAERFVTRQALQPFSERYFRTDDPLFTYAHEFHSGAASLRAPVDVERPFVSRPSPLDEAPTEVSVRDFVRFFRNPVRFFFNRRLNVYLSDDDATLVGREPIVLDRLQSSILAGRMLDRSLGGQALSDGFAPTRAEGALPLGEPGATTYDDLATKVDALDQQISALRGTSDAGSRRVELDVSGVKIAGRVEGVFDGRLVHHQYARIRGDHELQVWVRHLLLCATGDITESILIGRPSRHSASFRHGSRGLDVQVIRYSAPEDPVGVLMTLMALYKAGLEEPLLLFPRCGFVWQDLDGDKAQWRETNDAWGCSPWTVPGEGDEPYAWALMGGFSPLKMGRDDRGAPVLGGLPSRRELSFRRLAPEVFGPLLQHRAS